MNWRVLWVLGSTAWMAIWIAANWSAFSASLTYIACRLDSLSKVPALVCLGGKVGLTDLEFLLKLTWLPFATLVLSLAVRWAVRSAEVQKPDP